MTTTIQTELTILGERYKYLWLKRVTGFDPRNHCAACLLGSWSPNLPMPWQGRRVGGHHQGADPLPEHGLLYLCGVDLKAGWAGNLHVPMVPAPGETVTVDQPGGIEATFTNARIAYDPIPPLDIVDRAELRAEGLEVGRLFVTCRNYQVAFAHFGGVGSPHVVEWGGGDPRGRRRKNTAQGSLL